MPGARSTRVLASTSGARPFLPSLLLCLFPELPLLLSLFPELPLPCS